MPEIINLYADANPATTGVNFYVEHNRPTTRTDVTVAVYDLMGRMVWSDRRTDCNDTAGMPFAWDLTDNAGRRVSRGIYVYRATIDGDGELIQSKAKKSPSPRNNLPYIVYCNGLVKSLFSEGYQYSLCTGRVSSCRYPLRADNLNLATFPDRG